MKLLFLCLGLTLVYAYHEGEIDVVENFDPSKITGIWFNNLLATDQTERIDVNSDMIIFEKNIDVLKNSSMLSHFHTKINGQCTEVFLISNKTEENGVYTINYDGYYVFKVTDVKYDEYIIVFAKNEKHFLLAELYGRQRDVRTEIREKFVDFCAKLEIPEENIVDLTKVENPCLQA